MVVFFFRSNRSQFASSHSQNLVLQGLCNRRIHFPHSLLSPSLLPLGFPFPFPLRFPAPSLQARSVNPPPQRQPNARAYVPNKSHAPPSFLAVTESSFLLSMQFAWTGALPVTISKAGSDPDPAIG